LLFYHHIFFNVEYQADKTVNTNFLSLLVRLYQRNWVGAQDTSHWIRILNACHYFSTHFTKFSWMFFIRAGSRPPRTTWSGGGGQPFFESPIYFV